MHANLPPSPPPRALSIFDNSPAGAFFEMITRLHGDLRLKRKPRETLNKTKNINSEDWDWVSGKGLRGRYPC